MNKALSKSEMDLLLSKSVDLRESGHLKEAFKIISDLADRCPSEKAVILSLGYFHWEHGNLFDALPVFEKATALFPNSKLCSLGLFHVLWRLGKYDDALEEGKRFIAANQCDEYDQLIDDLRNAMRGTKQSR
jgi:tetratricopeptide (TPR) repeat protein